MSDVPATRILELIKSEWPTEPFGEFDDPDQWPYDGFPTDIRRKQGDEHYVFELDERRRSLELDHGPVIETHTGDRQREAIGVSYNFRVEQPITIRIEAADITEGGTVNGALGFKRLVAGTREVITRIRKHPPIDGGSAVDWHTITFEDETDLSVEHRDYYRRDLSVSLHGYELRDD